MEIKFDKIPQKIIKNSLIILTIIQGLTIFFLNYFVAPKAFDHDSAALFLHNIEMFRNETINLANWNYATSIETDTICILASPIYLVTGNLSVCFGVSHLIFYIIFAIALIDIYKGIGKSLECGLLSLILIFTPYSFGQLEWTNMMFFVTGSYEFCALLLVEIIHCIVAINDSSNKKRKYISIVFSVYLCLAESISTGSYALLVIIFPIVLWALCSSIKPNKIIINFKIYAYIFIQIATSIVGYIINKEIFGFGKTDSITLVNASNLFLNIFNQITGIFMLFKGVRTSNSIPVLSINGIITLLKFSFVILIFVSVVLIIYKNRNKKYVILEILFFVAIINLGVLFLTNTVYSNEICEYRYHIIWICCIFLCMGFMAEWNDKYTKYLLLITVCLACFINVDSYSELFNIQDYTADAKYVLKVMKDNDCDILYTSDLTIGKEAKILNYSIEYVDFIILDSGEIKEELFDQYADAKVDFNKNSILVVTENDYQKIKKTVDMYYDVYIEHDNLLIFSKN